MYDQLIHIVSEIDMADRYCHDVRQVDIKYAERLLKDFFGRDADNILATIQEAVDKAAVAEAQAGTLRGTCQRIKRELKRSS